MKTLIVIPALNPPEELLSYVGELQKSGFGEILIVDDGSSENYQFIFQTLQAEYGCHVLRHAKNLGKGRALKNAFNYFLTLPNVSEYAGVVTADSDGQHRTEDVVEMAKALGHYPTSLILGCRDFDLGNVPPKSKFGNKLTKTVFRLLYGKKISDTQTGLRGFPREIIPEMIDIDGERFEYESKMLIHVIEAGIAIKEITIETIYYDNNAETHFNPIKDSLKIYKVILGSFVKYLLSSLSSFIVDIGMFQLVLWIALASGLTRGAGLILVATILARLVSSYFNFSMNKNLVFNGEKSIRKTVFKYYSLAVVQMGLSALFVSLIWQMWLGSETGIKILVDGLLFLASYQIQRRWVFRRKRRA